MAFIGDGVYEAFDHHELMMVKPDGTSDVWGFGYQPTTEDIADRAFGGKGSGFNRGTLVYALCVQKIGHIYEVYDLKTLRRARNLGTWTIGLPVATHENVDAAIMAAVLLA
jgi:hypothetical protein